VKATDRMNPEPVSANIANNAAVTLVQIHIDERRDTVTVWALSHVSRRRRVDRPMRVRLHAEYGSPEGRGCQLTGLVRGGAKERTHRFSNG